MKVSARLIQLLYVVDIIFGIIVTGYVYSIGMKHDAFIAMMCTVIAVIAFFIVQAVINIEKQIKPAVIVK